MKPDHLSLDRLLSRLADDSLTAVEWAELEALLAEHPAARQRYLHYQDLHAELAQRTEAQAAAALPQAMVSPPVVSGPRHWFAPWAGAAAALVVLGGSGLWFWQAGKTVPQLAVLPAPVPAQAPAPAAVVALAHGTALEDGRELIPGTEAPTGLLNLTRGELGLRFASGAEATLRAPARFAVVSAMELRVDEGAAAVRAPDPVNGFTVRTPGGALVDLGTEFAMDVKADGSSRMLVREGKVVASLLGPDGSSTSELTATTGQMVVLDGRSVTLAPAPDTAAAFPPRLKMPAPPLQPGPDFETVMKASAPAAWWRFSTAPNGLVPNEMAPGNWDAAAIGSASLEDVAPDNKAARLGEPGGTAGYLVSPSFPGLAEHNVFSLELWACADAPAQATLAGLVLETDDASAKEQHLSVLEIMPPVRNQLGLIHQPNALRFLHRLPSGTPAGSNCLSNLPVTSGRWHHLAGTCDGRDLIIYLDGQPVQKAPAGPETWPGAFRLVLGKLRAIPENRDRSFKGWLDEATLHRRTLTAAEIAAHYQAMEIK